MNKLTESEKYELIVLCDVYNNLYGTSETVPDRQQFPMGRIIELVDKQRTTVMLKTKGGIKVVGKW